MEGSKASLIKSGKDDTPRKKKVKKKVKKTAEKTGEDNSFFNGTLAAELNDLQDDIVSHDTKKEEEEEEEEYSKHPYSTASVVLRSQPTEKFYIETDGNTNLLTIRVTYLFLIWDSFFFISNSIHFIKYNIVSFKFLNTI